MTEQNAASGASAQNADGRERRKGGRILPIAILAAALAAIAWGLYWFLVARWHVTTDDAYVQGEMINLAPQEAGSVTAVDVALTQYVRRGEVLVRLDDQDAQIGLARAEADLAQTARSVAALYQTAQADLAQVAARRAELAKARSDLGRAQRLAPSHAISKQTLEHAEIAVAQARAALQQALHQLDAARIATHGTAAADHPQVQQAEANLRSAWLALARTRILAPASGYVAQKNVAVGEQASTGSPLLAIVPLNDVYVDANFKETQLGELRIGQPAELTADLYGSKVSYHGKVLGFSSGTGAAFSVLPPQNASGNWIKIIQRLPVRIGLDPRELRAHPLLLGLSMRVDVLIRDTAGRMLSEKPSFDGRRRTEVYAIQAQGANALIHKILYRNLPAAGEYPDH
ncbi:MAG TPA: HlyD family efflux transporter periplasmic adaptor subunit [Steroidobacteraceae bacterium]|nr:HlyD family efflux transporter periplasmic adaptor subunit [Steroidobacteraceae bacterium]